MFGFCFFVWFCVFVYFVLCECYIYIHATVSLEPYSASLSLVEKTSTLTLKALESEWSDSECGGDRLNAGGRGHITGSAFKSQILQHTPQQPRHQSGGLASGGPPDRPPKDATTISHDQYQYKISYQSNVLKTLHHIPALRTATATEGSKPCVTKFRSGPPDRPRQRPPHKPHATSTAGAGTRPPRQAHIIEGVKQPLPLDQDQATVHATRKHVNTQKVYRAIVV